MDFSKMDNAQIIKLCNLTKEFVCALPEAEIRKTVRIFITEVLTKVKFSDAKTLKLAKCLSKIETTPVEELRSFIKGLCDDFIQEVTEAEQ